MIFFSVLLLLTLPLYLGSIATTSTLQNGDTASRSLSRSFAMILTAALWTVLATLIFAAYLEGGLSTASAILAVLLVPSSAVIAIIKINRTRSKAGDQPSRK
jgi:ABC-type sulfate transport system permease component